MKVWAKVMRGDKILRDAVIEGEYSLSSSDYTRMLQDIAYKLDLASPVSLPTHLSHFAKFNRVKYLPRDFVEDVEFDSFIVERILDDKKNKRRIC